MNLALLLNGLVSPARRLLGVALGVVVLNGAAFAQSETRINGLVTGDGKPLAGATVKIEKTGRGTTTDAEGRFQLQASGQETLVVSFIGYKTSTALVGNRTVVNVELVPESGELSEIVVVGYGTQRRRDMTGAVSSVSTQAIQEMPIATAEQGLLGRVAGVQVVQSNAAPGGAISVRVRGGNSVLGGNEPLYVIDGFPVYNNIGTNDGQTQPSNPLAAINPNDIVSMEVLKDASATAIFGARGANGVVIVTTRRGKAGEGHVDAEAYYGVQSVRHKLPMLTGGEYMELANERARNLGLATLPFPDASRYPANTDWQDAIYQQAPISNYALTFSGGSEASRYSVSGNWFEQQGVLRGSGFKRGSVRANLDNRLNSKLTLSTSMTASRAINQRSRTSINILSGVVYSALIAPPNAPVTNPDGTYFNIASLPTSDPAWINPVLLTEGFDNENSTNRILANSNLSYAFTPNLSFSVRLGIDYIDSRTDQYLSRTLPASTGSAAVNTSNNSTYLNENILSYKKQFGTNHALDLTAGYTWQQTVGTSLGAGTANFALDLFGTDNLSAGSTVNTPQTNRSENTLLSWLGRANYGFRDKYLLTVSGRADGSSRFGEGNKWGFFPSAALAWRVSEEPFLKNVNWIGDLKLRTSFGVTGNQEIGNYNSLTRLNTVSAVFGTGQAIVVGYAPVSMPNPSLKWETTAQYNVGVDASFLTGRLNLSLDYYVKNTTDLLTQLPVALSSGFGSILFNSGSVRNQGFELSADGVLLTKNKLRWNLGLNLATNSNQVLDVAVAGGQFFAPILASPLNESVNIIREGEPLSAFYGYVRDGLWETNQDATGLMPNAKAGDQRYQDLNGDGRITADDRTILGKPNPDLIYGITSQLSVGNFDLNVLFQGVSGVTVFNANKFSIGDSFARGANQLAEVKDRWTTTNPNPAALYPRASNVSPLISDRFFEDGSYFRLRNVQLGYNLPKNLTRLKWLRAARLYVSGQNLLTLTKYTGYDPEVSSTGGSDLRKGVDVGAYPAAKTWTVGLRLGL